MNRLQPVGDTLVRAEMSSFFDRPGDELGILGVVTKMRPEDGELRITIGLGDCGMHGTLLHKMDSIGFGKTLLPKEMAYDELMICGSSANFTSRLKKNKDLMVACTLSKMRKQSELSPQQTAAYAYMASLVLGGLLKMPRNTLNQFTDSSKVVFGSQLIRQLDRQIGRKIITDRE